MRPHPALPDVYQLDKHEAQALFGGVSRRGITPGVADTLACRFAHRGKEMIRMKASPSQLPAVKGVLHAEKLGYL